MNIITKDYLPKHKKKVMDLYKKSFGKELSEKLWRWRFDNYPFGDSIARTAFFGKQLIGYYLLQPIKLQVRDDTITSLFSMNTMTDPDFIGKGIMTSLANEVYNKACGEHIQLVIGFANENSKYMFTKKLGFKEIANPFEIFIDINDIHRLSSEYKISKITNFDESYSNYYEINRKISKFMIPRTSSYLNWRFLMHPEVKYHCFSIMFDNIIVGYFVLKNYEGRKCHIVDFLTDNKVKVFDAMLHHAIKFCKDNNVNELSLWINKNLPFYEHLKKFGIHERKMETSFIIKFLSESTRDNFENYDDWYITMSDSDVY